MHFPDLSCSGSSSWVLQKVRTQFGLHFVPFPGPSSSGNQVLGECTFPRCGVSYHLPGPSRSVSWVCHLRCTMRLFWAADLWLQPSQWISSIQDPRKAWLATGSHLQFGGGCHPGGQVCPFLALAATRLPLPPAGGGPLHFWLALIWYLLSPLFCEQASSVLG